MVNILTVDIGGTKVRVVEFEDAAATRVKAETDIAATNDPNELVQRIVAVIREQFSQFTGNPDDTIIGVSSRGVIHDGRVTDPAPFLIHFDDFPLVQALSDGLGGTRVALGNDAKMGALGAFPADFRGRGMYVTLSTGIGGGMVVDGRLSHDLNTMEVGHMRLRRDNAWQSWEEIASGRVFHKTHGDGDNIPADSPIWHEYATAVATGFLTLIPTLYPDTIAIGGKMSDYIEKFGPALRRIIADIPWIGIKIPEIVAVADQRYIVNRGAHLFALGSADDAR